ncbi:MAG: hypothetical protein JXB17_10370 [Bacteroidales bacterium]|nr:hypothetical protein [Bacteroidales bacterium]
MFKYLSILKIIVIITLIYFPRTIVSQNKVQVVTRIVEKELIYNKENILINTEKAKLNINGWDKNLVAVGLKIHSKNVDKEIARKELDYMKYSIVSQNSQIIIHNSILLSNNIEPLLSNISVEYEIWVPNGVKIFINNKFGSGCITNLNAKIEAYLEYCDMDIKNMQGQLKLNIKIGDLTIKHSNIKTKIETNYSEVNMDNISGNYYLKTNYGSINIIPDLLFDLTIEADKTDIFFINSNCDEFNLELETTFGKINFNRECYIKNKSKIIIDNIGNYKQDKVELKYAEPFQQSNIKINSRFGNVTLN